MGRLSAYRAPFSGGPNESLAALRVALASLGRTTDDGAKAICHWRATPATSNAAELPSLSSPAAGR